MPGCNIAVTLATLSARPAPYRGPAGCRAGPKPTKIRAVIPSPVIQPYAAIGLSPADRAQLALLFERGVIDGVRYVPAEGAQQAAFLVINADDRHALDDLRALEPAPCVVLIGHTHWGSGWPVVPRPISAPALAAAMRQLAPLLPPAVPGFEHTSAHAGLAGLGRAAAPASTPASTPVAAAPAAAPLAARRRAVAATVDGTPDTDLQAAYAVTSPSLPPDMADSVLRTALRQQHARLRASGASEVRAAARGDSTLVDISMPSSGPASATLVASPPQAPLEASATLASAPAQILIVAEFGSRTHTLPRGLRALGYGVDTANGEAQALALLPTRAYRVVFLDQASLGPALWGLAKQMLAARTLAGQPPHVAIVARKQRPLDRWRAHRIGCDAWMNVPLERERLIAFLARRGVKPQAALAA